jgi:hypothetical protein
MRELKQNPKLIGYSQGVRRVGLSASKRPVVLIVEDEFLLRMDAAEMIEAAGFEVVEAGNADQPSRSWNPVLTSPWSLPTSGCRAPWTA